MKKMKPTVSSWKRVTRTAFQIVIGLVTYVPVIVYALPADVAAGVVISTLGAWIAIVSGVVNALEDAGLIPAWLKDVDEG